MQEEHGRDSDRALEDMAGTVPVEPVPVFPAAYTALFGEAAHEDKTH